MNTTYCDTIMFELWRNQKNLQMMECHYEVNGMKGTFLNEQDHRFYEVLITPLFSEKEDECTGIRR